MRRNLSNRPSDGLSPRVRGNRRRHTHQLSKNRSIPARAGEPSPFRQPRGLRLVYPRACGGTVASLSKMSALSGLSPRVRGNLSLYITCQALSRSIPARAGEPGKAGDLAKHDRVYPRACGGTPDNERNKSGEAGLSPRVRGNRLPARPRQSAPRSIPARAGEPSMGLSHERFKQVYPRACGGTLAALAGRHPYQGLSPRVRGNRLRRPLVRRDSRSIPARAGEPYAGCGTVSRM